MKLKIAIIGVRGYPYVYGGYETFAKELGERMVQSGHEVTIYCHRNLFEERPKSVNGIKLKYFWSPQTKSLSQIVHSFQSMIHASISKVDVVLVVNSANGPLGLISKVFGKRTAVNVDGLEWLRPKWKGLGAKYFYWASKLSTRLFDRVITDAEAMRRVYLDIFKTDSTVIAYGANIRISKAPELIDQWGLESNEYYLIVGRLIPDNNADIILREFIASSSTKKMVIVGDVAYQDDYADSLKALSDDRLIFTGYVNDQDVLAELYHNCFAYFHGHEFGGTNPAMLKSLAYGCAVLALETVFNREMLEGDKHGLFFTKEIGDGKRLIEEVEKNHAKISELRNISRNRIEDAYTWEKITNQYIELFKEMKNK